MSPLFCSTTIYSYLLNVPAMIFVYSLSRLSTVTQSWMLSPGGELWIHLSMLPGVIQFTFAFASLDVSELHQQCAGSFLVLCLVPSLPGTQKEQAPIDTIIAGDFHLTPDSNQQQVLHFRPKCQQVNSQISHIPKNETMFW